jgi:protein-L-isoaspartate(D-aspartate) O-methyltransferase
MSPEHLEDRGIRDPDVLRILRTTPRELFVPEEVREFSYEDRPLAIGYGATISQPFIVAFMTQLLKVERSSRVLEIGTGSGYQAAILSQLAQRVYSIEIVPELAEAARERLHRLGYTNVKVRQGDGYEGWPEEAPFDRILLTAAPEELADTLVEQLAPNGRLIAPVGGAKHQKLLLVEKDRAGKIKTRPVTTVLFIPMRRPGC